MDPLVLAPTLVKILVPFMPVLLKKIGGEINEHGGELAKQVWEKLQAIIASDAGAQDAADKVAAQPENDRYQQIFELQLSTLLEQNATLQQQLTELLSEQGADAYTVEQRATGDRNVQIGRDASGSTIITGDKNKIDR